MPFRQIEIERAARLPGRQQGAVGGKQRRHAVLLVLRLGVGETGRAAHEATAEAVRGLAAVGADSEFGKQAATILIRTETAPALRERFWQHGDDAVGEIDAVTTVPRLVVEWRARADVMGYVGDSHDQPETVAVRLGPDRIVEITRVVAVDRDERDRADVLAAGKRGRAGARCLFERVGREFMRDLVRDNAEQTDRSSVTHGAKTLDDADGLESGAAMRQRVRENDLTSFSAASLARGHAPLRLNPAIDRFDAASAAGPRLIDAEQSAGLVGQTA